MDAIREFWIKVVGMERLGWIESSTVLCKAAARPRPDRLARFPAASNGFRRTGIQVAEPASGRGQSGSKMKVE